MTRKEDDVRHVQRIRRCTAVVVAVAALTGLGAGCAKDDSTAEPATTAIVAATTTAPPTTLNQAEKDKADIKAVVDRYWTELAIASDPPDDSRPALLATIVGAARQETQQRLAAMKAAGTRSRRTAGGPKPHRLSDFEVGGDEVTTLDCVIDDVVAYNADGTVKSDAVWSYIYRTTVARQAMGQWAISSMVRESESPGRVLCPALQ